MNCRICNTTTKKFLDLGRQPIANNFLEDLIFDEYFYHLEVFFCPECYTVQIGTIPNKERIFNENYTFFTSTSNYMIKHFWELANIIKNNDYLSKDGFIVEIGSNDGTFLKNFRGYKHLGIEPSASVNDVAKKKGLRTWNKFFSYETAEEIIELKGQADVIVTTNCFPHMVDRDSVLKGIKILLKPDGVWINEEASLSSVINLGSYDQFYNEHVFFSSVASFRNTMFLYNLNLLDVDCLPVHGGSLRCFSSHADTKGKKEKIEYYVNMENLRSFERLQEFGEKAEFLRRKLLQYLSLLKETVGYGATAKSTTVLNYCKIGTNLISKIYDTTPAKQGSFSPGMHIPVVSYDTFKEDKPKNVVLFAWNHAQEIYEKEKDMKINWILPI